MKYNYLKLAAFGKVLECSCNVRNLENKRRAMNEVVFTTTWHGDIGVPYSPQVFPMGHWTVSRPMPISQANKYEWPFFIPTDAHQPVFEWSTEQAEHLLYKEKTEHLVIDYGYGLHFSSSMTTLGCIRIATEEDLRWLVEQINAQMDKKIPVYLDVLKLGEDLGGT